MNTWQRIKANPKLIERYLLREKVIDSIRDFFKKREFHEVFTPILIPIPSAEPNLEVFETELRTKTGKKRSAYLIMSPEYSLKKLLAAGFENIFEVTKAFRNEEEVSSYHNPEFTILEWYRGRADYTHIMQDFENLFIKIVRDVNPKANLSSWEYQGERYDISQPWLRISVVDAFQKYSGINTETLLSLAHLSKVASKKGYKISKTTTWEQIFFQIFFNEIEPRFKESHKPVFFYDYPILQSSLARKKKSDPRFAERFEVFLGGLELGNCFSELTDPVEQRARLRHDIKERKRLGKTIYPIDNDLIAALKVGMPQSAGIAVGVDRLIMLAGNFSSISETLLFPANQLFDL